MLIEKWLLIKGCLEALHDRSAEQICLINLETEVGVRHDRAYCVVSLTKVLRPCDLVVLLYQLIGKRGVVVLFYCHTVFSFYLLRWTQDLLILMLDESFHRQFDRRFVEIRFKWLPCNTWKHRITLSKWAALDLVNFFSWDQRLLLHLIRAIRIVFGRLQLHFDAKAECRMLGIPVSLVTVAWETRFLVQASQVGLASWL